MSKMIRWALAFTSVMAVPTSAMALVGDHDHAVTIINGRQEVELGVWKFSLDQLIYTPYYEACAYFVKWINYAYLVSSTNLFLEEVTTLGQEDCELNSYYPLTTIVKLSETYVSKGFDKFQQKRDIYKLLLSEDGFYGDMHGLIQYHPAAVPLGLKVKPV